MASDPQVKMNFWGRILNRAGWSVSVKAPRRDKCVICVAPHTSNWDFVLGYLAWLSVGRKANFDEKSMVRFPAELFFPLAGRNSGVAARFRREAHGLS